jgi:hypothetical protein
VRINSGACNARPAVLFLCETSGKFDLNSKMIEHANNQNSESTERSEHQREQKQWAAVLLSLVGAGSLLWLWFMPDATFWTSLFNWESLPHFAMSSACGLLIWALVRVCVFVAASERRAALIVSGQHSNPDWHTFARHFLACHEGVAAATQGLIENLWELYEREGMKRVLPVQQAIRLVEAHYRQWQQISAIDERLMNCKELHQEIRRNLEELRTLGESNVAGERGLKELEQDEAELLSLRNRILQSSEKLEALVPVVEIEWKKANLQKETNRLAEIALRSTAEEPSHIYECSTVELEQQITFEINTYLQLENETQQRLEAQ